jgi:FkbM family methyltransferase
MTSRRFRQPTLEHDLREGQADQDRTLEQLRAEVADLRHEVQILRNTDNRVPCYVGDGVALAPTHFDRWLYLDTNDRSVSPRILTTGTWEQGVTRFFQTYMPENARYVEVGANYGYYTMQAACLVGDKGTVTAFEPGPRMFSLLERSIDINGVAGRTTLHQSAVSDTVGSAILYMKRDWHGGSSLYEEVGSTLDITEVEVPTTTLDEALGATKVDFLKIDAEGAELSVLGGAEAVLAASPDLLLMIEVYAGQWAPADGDTTSFLRLLRDQGFRFWLVEEDGTGVESSIDEILDAATVARDVACSRQVPTPRPGFPALID